MPKEHDAEVKSGAAFTLDEIGEGKGIETVKDVEAKAAMELEKFMNDILEVVVHEDGQPGSLDVILLTVNGTNQPIIRGRVQKIRRKYVESLARSRITAYEQRVMDPTRPENIQMIPKVALTYPFSVRKDPSRNGAAWLDAILSTPA